MKLQGLMLCLIIILLGCIKVEDKEKNQVQVRGIKDFETLNPITSRGKEATAVIGLIYQSLLTIDPTANQIQPVLAEKLPEIEINDSLSVFHYALREESQWPNGEPITAHDVLFTLKVSTCPFIQNERKRISLAFINDMAIDSISNRKFTFECEGYVEDMTIMTGGFPILPEYKYDPKGLLRSYALKEIKSATFENDRRLREFAANFAALAASHDPDAYIGSGGYKLVSWKTDQFIILEKKEKWWAETLDLPYMVANPQKITFQIIPDGAAAVLALKNRQLDVMRDIPVNDYKTLEKDSSFSSAYHLFSPFTYAVNYIGINARLPKFNGKNTRKALAHLIDWSSIAAVIGQSPSSRASSLISPYDTLNYNEDIQPYSYDPETAIHLLTADGWYLENERWYRMLKEKKERLSLQLQYRAGNYNYENIALIFKQAAGDIGIQVEVMPVESSILSNNLKSHNFELYLRALEGNPFAFNFMPILHTESAVRNGMNYTAFGHKESDRLIEGIIGAKDKEQQAAQIKAFQEMLAEEANLIFLYFNEQKIAVHKRFENLQISGLYPNYEVNAFLLKEE